MEEKQMRPIWYFVGLMLLAMGGLIVGSGVYQLFSPPEVKTVLAETHPSIWWGGIMMIGGGVLFAASRKRSV